ncbi:MAG: hypothetical protein ABI597_08660 [Gammaproteobacteria bacterium]
MFSNKMTIEEYEKSLRKHKLTDPRHAALGAHLVQLAKLSPDQAVANLRMTPKIPPKLFDFFCLPETIESAPASQGNPGPSGIKSMGMLQLYIETKQTGMILELLNRGFISRFSLMQSLHGMTTFMVMANVPGFEVVIKAIITKNKSLDDTNKLILASDLEKVYPNTGVFALAYGATALLELAQSKKVESIRMLIEQDLITRAQLNASYKDKNHPYYAKTAISFLKKNELELLEAKGLLVNNKKPVELSDAVIKDQLSQHPPKVVVAESKTAEVVIIIPQQTSSPADSGEHKDEPAAELSTSFQKFTN